MARRNTEMGTPQTPKGSENIGNTKSTVSSHQEFFDRVRRKSRELDLAIKSTLYKISKPRD